MSISKLHIFAKDTDAPATQAGFEYQKLKTLETWIHNKVNGVDEIIYCDYEEDIFQRDAKKATIKFRQVKLYSRNFSFSSEEVYKALQHFFMLFVKSDYVNDTIEFVFEANSSIARNKGDNEAELMHSWEEAQGKLAGELLLQCCSKAKQIVTEYIQAGYSKLASKADEKLKVELDEAKGIFDKLETEQWAKFVNSIRWSFEGVSPYEAIENSKSRIAELLAGIPFVAEKPEHKFAHGHLLTVISERTIQKEPEDRKLTNELLDKALLQLGGKEDIWYSGVYTKWSSRKAPTEFLIGEFFEIIEAAKYCRWNPLVHAGRTLWESLLQAYAAMTDIILNCKRRSVFELLMLKMQIEFGNTKMETPEDELVRFYYNTIEESESAEDMENAVVLHQILTSLELQEKTGISKEELVKWKEYISQLINKKLEVTTNPNTKCAYYEVLAFSTPLYSPGLTINVDNALAQYNKIVPLLPTATMYNIADLSAKLHIQKNMLLKVGLPGSKEAVKKLKAFLESIEPIVQERKGKHFSAHSHVKSGMEYLDQSDFESYLEALDEFHKAKDLWNQERTMEGAILAMMNIAQVYLGAGMNYAAKYYAMTALWDSIHMGTKNLDRISGCYALIMVADFEAGAWLSALNDFEQYIKSTFMFDTESLHEKSSELFVHAMSNEALLLKVIPLMDKELSGFIAAKKQELGWLNQTTIDPLMKGIDEKIGGDGLPGKVAAKLTDIPLNDAGTLRTICWSTEVHVWKVEFENEWSTNAIAEEFCAVLQIMLVELSRLQVDLHVIDVTVTIRIKKSMDGRFTRLEKAPSNSENIYTIAIPEITGTGPKTVPEHYARITASIAEIIKDLSVLSNEETDTIITGLYQSELPGKALIVNAYQVILKDFFAEKEFSERQAITSGVTRGSYSFRKLNEIFQQSKHLSPKYNQERAMGNIENRYAVVTRTLHLSLMEWKKEPGFRQLVLDLRKEGWLDWQILNALNSQALSYKINRYFEGIDFGTEEQFITNFEHEMDRLLRTDEEVSFMQIPIGIFLTPEFRSLIDKVPVQALNSYGLLNGSKYPNLAAVRHFLANRFNFLSDHPVGNNPLVDIQ